MKHEFHVQFVPECEACVADRQRHIADIDRRSRHAGGCLSRWPEYSDSDCQCGAYIEFASMGSSTADSPVAERSFYDFPRDTTGVVLALRDGRTITIADLGDGPTVRVQGPNDELLADLVLPRSAQDTVESIQCPLRGIRVPVAECVASCPAPEQRDVCAMNFDPTVSPQMAAYQADGR